MSTTITYASLFADVQGYLERGNSVADPEVFAQIPRLINATERKIVQTLKLLGTIEVLNDISGFTAGISVIAKPDRWRQTVSMSFGKGDNSNVRTPLFPRSYEYCRAYWPDDSLVDEPAFYADYDLTHYLIAPTPDQTYPVEIISYMQPVLLDDANQTNFFTAYTPNMLLYGTLLEATPYLKNDERIPTWQGFWGSELATLDGQDLQRILDRASERKRP